MGWQRDSLQGELEAWVVRDRPALPPALDAIVDALWVAERGARPGLFNGEVFSVDRRIGCRLEGHWTEYRRIVAQLRRPDLTRDVGARPLSVAGLLEGPDGIVMGRRPSHAAYQPNVWQLAPAGNVDRSSAEGDRVDLLRALMTELREELGLSTDSVCRSRHVCLVYHPGIGIVDLGISLTTELSAAEIRHAHAEKGDGEYPAVRIVRRTDLPGFLAHEGEAVGPQTVPFLQALGILP